MTMAVKIFFYFFILVSNSRSFEARELVSCHLWLDDNGSQSEYSCTPFMSNICSENMIAFFLHFLLDDYGGWENPAHNL